MKNRTTLAAWLLPVLGALCAAAPAHARMKSCEELRDEIAARINLPADSYRLEIAAKDSASQGRTMGSCEGGTRKVVAYFGESAKAPAAEAPAAPATPEPVVSPPPVPDQRPAAETAATEPQPTPASARVPAPNASRRGAVDEATLLRYREWIAEARARHPYTDSEERMLQVMLCESKGNAAIVNPAGPYSGLFQYAPGTWKAAWNAYRDEHILDAKAQIFATALAWEQRKQGWWGCYKRAH